MVPLPSAQAGGSRGSSSLHQFDLNVSRGPPVTLPFLSTTHVPSTSTTPKPAPSISDWPTLTLHSLWSVVEIAFVHSPDTNLEVFLTVAEVSVLGVVAQR